MPKILKLEFDESITLDEILKELLYYHSRNQLVCCRYKGNYLSNKDISELNLQLRVWLEYFDDNGEKKNIYYRT